MALKPFTSKPILARGKGKMHYGWIIMIANFIVMMACLGIGVNSLMVFPTTIAMELGIPIPAFFKILSINYFMLFVFTPVAGRVLYRNDCVKVVMICAIFMFIGWMSMMFWKTLGGFVISMILLGGSSGFFSFMIAPTLINAWFAKKAGFALGVVVCGTTLGGGLFQMIAGQMLMKHSYQFVLMVLGIILIAILEIVPPLFLRSKPEDIGMTPYGIEAVTEEEKALQLLEASEGLTMKEVKKKPIYYFLMVYVIILVLAVAFQTQQATFCQSIGLTVGQAGIIGALSYWIGGCGGNLITGFVNDKVNYAVGVSISVILGLIGFIVYFILLGGFLKTGIPPAMGIACVGGILYGFVSTMIDMAAPLITRGAFGMKDYTRVYSFVAMFIPLISCTVGTMLYPSILGKTGSYSIVLILGVVGCIVSTVILFILRGRAVKMEQARIAARNK